MQPMTRFAPRSRHMCSCRGSRPFGLAAALAGLVAAACVDNSAPVVANEISAAELLVGDSLAVDLAGHFEDPDGDVLRYEAETSAPGTAGVAVAGSVLTVTALALGEAAVTVTAHDTWELAASQEFMVTVAVARRLTNHGAWQPAWSPDGTRIAFASAHNVDRRMDIYWAYADGSGMKRLTSNNRSDDMFPTWSPDGTRIAFASDRDGGWEIYVMDADGSDMKRLTNNSAWDLASSWSPDGTRIAFVSDRDGGWEIYVMDADGSGVERLTNNNGSYPAWSPDGTRIAFASDRYGYVEIYVMDADGSGVKWLTSNSCWDMYPAWSPDGTEIAFASDRHGDSEIYVMDADGSGVKRLTNNRRRDVQPAWSPDGTRIAFVSDNHIYVMDLATR